MVAGSVRDAVGDRRDDGTDQRRCARRQRRQPPPGAARLRRQLAAIAGARVVSCWVSVPARAASSEWSTESRAIGRPIAPAPTRRAVLAETIDALRAIWSGDAYAGEHVQVAASMAVTDGAPVPPIIVGAASRPTIRVGCEHADGVNLLPEGDLAERVAFARDNAIREPFEVSAFARPRRRSSARR